MAALAPSSCLDSSIFMGGRIILRIQSIHWNLILFLLATPWGGLRLGILSTLMGGHLFILMGGLRSLLLGSLPSCSPQDQGWFNMGGFLMVLHLCRCLLVVQVLRCGLCPMRTSNLLPIWT
jgi:hypothetical protein